MIRWICKHNQLQLIDWCSLSHNSVRERLACDTVDPNSHCQLKELLSVSFELQYIELRTLNDIDSSFTPALCNWRWTSVELQVYCTAAKSSTPQTFLYTPQSMRAYSTVEQWARTISQHLWKCPTFIFLRTEGVVSRQPSLTEQVTPSEP